MRPLPMGPLALPMTAGFHWCSVLHSHACLPILNRRTCQNRLEHRLHSFAASPQLAAATRLKNGREAPDEVPPSRYALLRSSARSMVPRPERARLHPSNSD